MSRRSNSSGGCVGALLSIVMGFVFLVGGVIAIAAYIGFYGIAIIIALIIVIVVVVIKKRRKPKNVTAETSTEITTMRKIQSQYRQIDIDSMDGHEFEYFCADLLRQNGYTDVSVTQGSHDRGIDVFATMNNAKYGIQCKRYQNKVGFDAIKDAYTGKDLHHCNIAAVMTNNYFTPQATETGTQLGVLLWDRPVILAMMSKNGYHQEVPRVASYHNLDNSIPQIPNENYEQRALYPMPEFDEQKGVYIKAYDTVGADIPKGRYILDTNGNGNGRVEIYASFDDYKADKPIEIKVFANEYKVQLKMDGMFIYIENTNLIKHSEIG